MSALILTAVLVGWFMARRALSGVEAVTRTARQISESDLSRRVPVMARHEEIDRLAVTFNQMLDRIEKLVAGIREMSDNIAHDLKSPVARIRGMAEISLSGESSGEDDLTLAGSTIEECDRLLDMINTMLMISKTDAGAGDIVMGPVNMADLVRAPWHCSLPWRKTRGLPDLRHAAGFPDGERDLRCFSGRWPILWTMRSSIHRHREILTFRGFVIKVLKGLTFPLKTGRRHRHR
jgi:HAMP domain-containing protein